MRECQVPRAANTLKSTGPVPVPQSRTMTKRNVAVRDSDRTTPQQKPPVARRSARRREELEVLRQFRVIFSSAKKHFRAVEARCGVSGSQLWALIELRERPGLKVSELAGSMSIRPSTASNLLDKLEARGLIRRARSDTDQRVVQVFLTKDGSSVVATAPTPARGVVPDALGRLPAATLRCLAQDLDALIGNFEVLDAGASSKPLSDI